MTIWAAQFGLSHAQDGEYLWGAGGDVRMEPSERSCWLGTCLHPNWEPCPMLERSARDGVVSIPNETQPRGRGTCALKQPELCAGTQGSGEQREMGWRTSGVLLCPGFAFSQAWRSRTVESQRKRETVEKGDKQLKGSLFWFLRERAANCFLVSGSKLLYVSVSII